LGPSLQISTMPSNVNQLQWNVTLTMSPPLKLRPYGNIEMNVLLWLLLLGRNLDIDWVLFCWNLVIPAQNWKWQL